MTNGDGENSLPRTTWPYGIINTEDVAYYAGEGFAVKGLVETDIFLRKLISNHECNDNKLQRSVLLSFISLHCSFYFINVILVMVQSGTRN